MKFLVTWRVHEDKRHETLKAFAAMSDADHAENLGSVKMIGRWHDLVAFTGVAIVEADDADALTAFLLQWNTACDIDCTPVLDDKEAQAVGSRMDG